MGVWYIDQSQQGLLLDAIGAFQQRDAALLRVWLVFVGVIATILAIAGAVLPGLPTTPFVLVALWAFAKSSERLYRVLDRIPILRHGLAEAHRFERRRAIRLPIKIAALTMAWSSVAVTAYFGQGAGIWLVAVVAIAAMAATAFMFLIPTDQER